jgi:Arm DNA-binding domain
MPSRAPRRKNFWGNSRGKANIEVARYLLSARQVQTAGAGDLCDGGGLLLRVQASSAAWVFRFTSPTGKRRELGLGAAVRNSIADAGKSLIDARDAADAARKLLRDGRDPIDVKVAERDAARKAEAEKKASATRERTTLARVARAYLAEVDLPATRRRAQVADCFRSAACGGARGIPPGGSCGPRCRQNRPRAPLR